MANDNQVLKMLREHSGNVGYHPLCSLLDLVDEQDCTIGEKINIHKSIAKYVEAEHKAVEFTGKVSTGVDLRFDIGHNS